MTVLVIGGTRFIGPVTVDQLVQRGHAVTVFHRGQSNAALPRGVKEIHGDRNNAGQLRDALAQTRPEAVLDLCAYFGRHMATLREAGVDAKRHLLVSSCDVYRNYGGLIGRETTPPDATPLLESAPLRTFRYPYAEGQYAREGFEDYDKIPLEEDVLSKGGMVARLPMVYGPGDTQHRVGQYLGKLDAGRRQILLGQHEAQWKTCRAHVRQVARAMVEILEAGATAEVYNIAEAQALTEAEWVTAIIAQSGANAEVVTVKDELIAELQGHIERPEWHLAVDSTKLRTQLGFAEDCPFDEGLRETIAWERKNPGDPPTASELEAEDRLLAAV